MEKLPWPVFTFLKLCGRIEPIERYRSKRVLPLFEREEISRVLATNLSIHIIAKIEKKKRVVNYD